MQIVNKGLSDRESLHFVSLRQNCLILLVVCYRFCILPSEKKLFAIAIIMNPLLTMPTTPRDIQMNLFIYHKLSIFETCVKCDMDRIQISSSAFKAALFSHKNSRKKQLAAIKTRANKPNHPTKQMTQFLSYQ